MGEFKELYDYCQTLEPKVSRKVLTPKTLEITGVEKISARKVTLDTTACRGFFLSVKNKTHPIVLQHGCDVIVLARDQNKCWERFVYTKELMHLFDNDDEPTDSAEKFEKLLTELAFPSALFNQSSKQTTSDRKTFWMALACLCPEKNRLEFEIMRNDQHIDDYGIALQLRIPEQFVPLLFLPSYRIIIDLLII